MQREISFLIFISMNNIFLIQKMNAKRFFLLFIVYSNACSSTGCNSSLLTFYFKSGLSFVEMYIEWRGNTCLLRLHTHKKIYNFRWGCPQFYYKLKTFIIEFLDKMRGSFYTHMSCKQSYLPLHTLFFRFVTEYKWHVLYMYIKSLLKLR